jgi:hypothetical protein
LAVSGAPHGLVPINRSIGPVALARIADQTGQSLLAEITPFDWLGVAVEQIQRRANAEAARTCRTSNRDRAECCQR